MLLSPATSFPSSGNCTWLAPCGFWCLHYLLLDSCKFLIVYYLGAGTILTDRYSVCAVTIPYIALLPNYLSSDDKTWYNSNVQIFHQVLINMSVTTAGILSVRRFLSDLQTGKLGMILNDREIEMTAAQRSTNRSRNDSGNKSATTSGFFGRSKKSTNDQSSKSQTRSNVSVMGSSNNMRLRPDDVARYTTHVVGGSSTGVGSSERENRSRNAPSGDTTKSDDEISDDKSTSSLRKNGVYQRRDFEMHVEYDYPDGESSR